MIKLGIIMDPISSINIKKDSSFAMLLEAQNRGYEIYYMEISSLYLYKNKSMACALSLSVKKDNDIWYKFHDKKNIFLKDLDVILMRKNPPFDTEFLYATYILEYAESEGVIVINKPQSIRDCNEKLFSILFPSYIPDMIVSRCDKHIRNFLKKHDEIILKPLNGMGGKSVFFIKKNDPNLSVIIETLTYNGRHLCIAQKFLHDIKYGDKRILIVNGKPIPYCLARIAKKGEIRANLMAGGYGEVRPLSKNDWKIAQDVAIILKKKELIFVGLDIIGDYLTEINVTSPTCIQEIELCSSISITGILMDAIEKRLSVNKW